LIEQDRMQRLCARLIPERRAWRLVQPNRIAAEERFPERNNARARIERGLDMSDGGFGAGADVKRNRARLDNRGLDDRLRHGSQPTALVRPIASPELPPDPRNHGVGASVSTPDPRQTQGLETPT